MIRRILYRKLAPGFRQCLIGLALLCSAATQADATASATDTPLAVARETRFSEWTETPGWDRQPVTLSQFDCRARFRADWVQYQLNNSGLNRRSNLQSYARDMTAFIEEQCNELIGDTLRHRFNTAATGHRQTPQNDPLSGPTPIRVQAYLHDIDIYVPDTEIGTIVRSQSRRFGRMSMTIEFSDHDTGAVVARIRQLDKRISTRNFQLGSTVNNRAEIRQQLKNWSDRLIDEL